MVCVLRGPADEARSSIAEYPEATGLTWLKNNLETLPLSQDFYLG